MTNKITITIPGELRGKGRPRFSRRSGTAYTPARTANMEAWIKQCAVDQYGTSLINGPIRLCVHIKVRIPASWSKKRRGMALAGWEVPMKVPDIDNCIKIIGDALNGIVWVDDKQIFYCEARKTYGEVEETTITVEW